MSKKEKILKMWECPRCMFSANVLPECLQCGCDNPKPEVELSGVDENQYERGAESFTGRLNGTSLHVTMASFDSDDIKLGDTYICTRSSLVPKRVGEHFEIKNKWDREWLELAMCYGDRFDRIGRKPKKSNKRQAA